LYTLQELSHEVTARNWLCRTRGTGEAGRERAGSKKKPKSQPDGQHGHRKRCAAPRAAGSEDGCALSRIARPARVRRRRQHHLLGANFTDETESSQHGGSATSCARDGSAAHGPQTRISARNESGKATGMRALRARGSENSRGAGNSSRSGAGWQQRGLPLARRHALTCLHAAQARPAGFVHEPLVHEPLVHEPPPRITRRRSNFQKMRGVDGNSIDSSRVPWRFGTHMLELLGRASAPDAAEATRQEASSAVLTRVLDPQLHSLAASALGSTDTQLRK
jgi:hypothetical protein